MKLILTREVAGLGQAGDVVTVKDGYGRNFLLPRSHAIKNSLEKAPIAVKAKVGSTGSLFGSGTDKQIVLAIKGATGVDIDRHKLKVAHIKKLGKYTVKVALTTQVSASVVIEVVAA